jgi:PHD/YefM family antitoxin component YafN of YafNO toxin-antitoxin module
MMNAVTATEFTRNFGRYRDMAQREPVAVTNHDRVTGYFVSAPDFEEYRRLKAQTLGSLAERSLVRSATGVSAPSFADVWSNPEDDVYDAL